MHLLLAAKFWKATSKTMSLEAQQKNKIKCIEILPLIKFKNIL